MTNKANLSWSLASVIRKQPAFTSALRIPFSTLSSSALFIHFGALHLVSLFSLQRVSLFHVKHVLNCLLSIQKHPSILVPWRKQQTHILMHFVLTLRVNYGSLHLLNWCAFNNPLFCCKAERLEPKGQQKLRRKRCLEKFWGWGLRRSSLGFWGSRGWRSNLHPCVHPLITLPSVTLEYLEPSADLTIYVSLPVPDVIRA